MKKRRKIILLTSAILLYLVICLSASFWNMFIGPIQYYLYSKYLTTYDGDIEVLLGYKINKNGDYYIYVEGKIKSNNSQRYLITIPKIYIDDYLSIDTRRNRYIRVQKDDISPIGSVNIELIQKDDLVSIQQFPVT